MWGPDVWVLHQQAVNRKPFKWFILELVGAGDNKIMLAIRRDNLYITGFTDGSGLWYIFSNRLPARRRLPWSGRRVEESGGGSRQQADHPWSRRTRRQLRAQGLRRRRLRRSSPGNRPFHDVILEGWESGADVGELHELVIKWRVVSCALMISVQEGGTWSSKEAKVDIALKTVAVALWPWRELCSETITWLQWASLGCAC